MGDGNQSVVDYIKQASRQIDGVIWIGCSILSMIIAILLGLDLIPWLQDKVGKRIVILLFMPLILFLLLVNLRLLPFANGRYAPIFRSCFIFFAFVFFNF